MFFEVLAIACSSAFRRTKGNCSICPVAISLTLFLIRSLSCDLAVSLSSLKRKSISDLGRFQFSTLKV